MNLRLVKYFPRYCDYKLSNGLYQDNIEYANTLEMKDGVRGWKVLEGPEKCTACAQAIINLL